MSKHQTTPGDGLAPPKGDAKARQILLVTNELYPQKKGGIGRVIHTLALANHQAGSPADIHILCMSDQGGGSPAMSKEALTREIGDLATLYFCPESLQDFKPVGPLFDAYARDDWGLAKAMTPSYLAYLSIRQMILKGHGPFDVIEFPDYGGWAYVTLEAKRAGLAFQETAITVRLHSSLGMITAAEAYYHSPSAQMGWQQDMERHCLLHADQVIGHLRPVIEANAAHYGFDDAWQAGVTLNCPPILLSQAEQEAANAPKADNDAPIFVFSSRLQPFKRPDIFIRAAIRFLEETPIGAHFLAISYGWDSDYINWLRGSIPTAFRDRIKIRDDISTAERLEILSSAIVVIPSVYESLCLFAYESALMGRRVILNAACPAFGPDTPWQHGDNCLTFDGSVKDLSQKMKTALDWQPTEPVIVPEDTPYWLASTRQEPSSGAAETLSLAIIHYGFSSHQEAAAFANAQVDAMTPIPGGQSYLAVPTSMDPALDLASLALPVLPVSGKNILPSDLFDAALTVNEDLVLFLPHTARAEPVFLRHALDHLARKTDLNGLAAFVQFEDAAGKPLALKPAAPGCKTGALTGDAGLDCALILRKSALHVAPFDDQARQDWYRVFTRQLLLSDLAIAVMPQPGAYQTTSLLQRQEKRQITSSLAGQFKIVPPEVSALGLKMDIAPKRHQEDLQPKQRYLTFYGGYRVYPSRPMPDFEPVQFRKDNNDLLVHALDDDLLVARLPIETGGLGVRAVIVEIAHKGKDQAGIDAALWLDPTSLSAHQLGQGRCAHKSGWTTLNPKDRREISVTLPAVLGSVHAYVAIKLPDGADQSRAWSAVTGLRVVH